MCPDNLSLDALFEIVQLLRTGKTRPGILHASTSQVYGETLEHPPEGD
jgi:hypothetical protein